MRPPAPLGDAKSTAPAWAEGPLSSASPQSVGVVGLGRMAQALLLPLMECGLVPRERVQAVVASQASAQRLATAHPGLAVGTDPEAAWRAEAVLLGPPPRSATERAYSFDTIGMLCLGRGQTELARRMFERSAEAAPNPSTFVRMGMAETMLGRPADAMAHYRHAASLDPDLATAWRGVAAAASATGDRTAMEDAVRNMTRLEPGNPLLVDARAWLAADDSLRRVTRH